MLPAAPKRWRWRCNPFGADIQHHAPAASAGLLVGNRAADRRAIDALQAPPENGGAAAITAPEFPRIDGHRLSWLTWSIGPGFDAGIALAAHTLASRASVPRPLLTTPAKPPPPPPKFLAQVEARHGFLERSSFGHETQRAAAATRTPDTHKDVHHPRAATMFAHEIRRLVCKSLADSVEAIFAITSYANPTGDTVCDADARVHCRAVSDSRHCRKRFCQSRNPQPTNTTCRKPAAWCRTVQINSHHPCRRKRFIRKGALKEGRHPIRRAHLRAGRAFIIERRRTV